MSVSPYDTYTLEEPGSGPRSEVEDEYNPRSEHRAVSLNALIWMDNDIRPFLYQISGRKYCHFPVPLLMYSCYNGPRMPFSDLKPIYNALKYVYHNFYIILCPKSENLGTQENQWIGCPPIFYLLLNENRYIISLSVNSKTTEFISILSFISLSNRIFWSE